jgi:DNA-binding response OmpR family regulator
MTAAATENGGNQPPTLLVVEDDALILDVIRIELNDAGFEIVVARNGAEALSELDADATRFKAVISDIRLGEGPNGWDVGRHARELVSDMPVVYISGDSGHEWSARGVPDSVLIAKPFAPAQLITAVSTLVTSTDTRRGSV